MNTFSPNFSGACSWQQLKVGKFPNCLLKRISANPTRHLMLVISKPTFSKFKSFSGQFLIHVASLVESIHIEQYYNSKIDHRNYLLGAIDADWATIILEMFSRKLSKIFIKNFSYPGYLSKEGTRTLVKVGCLRFIT